MDFSRPLDALVPGVTGRVLAVLARTGAPLSGRGVAELAGVSAAQAARVLPHLVVLGIVEARPVPPSVLYSFVPDHVAAEPLRALASLSDAFVDRLAEEIARLTPAPACVAAFGSFARGEADAQSDIDLLVVRPTGTAPDDGDWEDVVDTIRARARRLSGNSVDILEAGRAEARQRLRSGRAVWGDIARDALVVTGPPLDRL